jgi:O-antigen ligase
VVGEIGASFDPSGQSANSDWRLAFWGFLLKQSAKDPVFGVGFGKPADFVWHGVTYDARVGDPYNGADVTGAHNSFVGMVYRAGLPALIALLALMALAVFRLVPYARRATGDDRALAIWPLAALAIATVEASLNVSLEGPYMGILFFGGLGLALLAPFMLDASHGANQPRA